MTGSATTPRTDTQWEQGISVWVIDCAGDTWWIAARSLAEAVKWWLDNMAGDAVELSVYQVEDLEQWFVAPGPDGEHRKLSLREAVRGHIARGTAIPCVVTHEAALR